MKKLKELRISEDSHKIAWELARLGNRSIGKFVEHLIFKQWRRHERRLGTSSEGDTNDVISE